MVKPFRKGYPFLREVVIMAKGKEAKRVEEKKEIKEQPKEEAKETKEEPKQAVGEEKKEKKKEKKSQKERPKSKKKHTKIQVWKLYEVSGSAVKRKNEPCPRCGPGTFLAFYKNRKYCGKCGWAQLLKEEKK